VRSLICTGDDHFVSLLDAIKDCDLSPRVGPTFTMRWLRDTVRTGRYLVVVDDVHCDAIGL